MVRNIINSLRLRETNLNFRRIFLCCKTCYSELKCNIQCKSRFCSQICYNMYYYNEYFEYLNKLSDEIS